MKLNIAYAPDDKYTNQTVVSMQSAVENNKEHEIEFIIMYSKLSDESKKKLESVGAKIRFLEMDECLFENLPLSHWVTVQAWFRIKLPDLCPDLDKIMYLDCDTLILGDLSEVFGTNLEGKFLAGVKDVWGVDKYVRRLRMKSEVYLNSGMLLFNCDYCRNEKFFDKIVDFAKNNAKIIEFCDQDSINKVADEYKIVLLPKYNFMDTWWRGGYYEFEGKEELEYLQAKDNPVIVHLTGLKPAFKGCGNKFCAKWWEYARKTAVYDELLEDYEKSVAPTNEEPFLRKVFSIKNEYRGKNKTKVLRLLGAKIKLSKTLSPDELERKRRKREHKKLSANKFSMPAYYSKDYDKTTGIDLITVAFNNPKVIEYQIKLIRKFAQGDFTILICDNSNVKEKSEAIRKVCEDLDVTFIRVQPKKNPNGYSDSHGIALNWIYQNIIKKRGNNFAFLDHDIFPVKPVNVEEYIKTQDFYGYKNLPHKETFLNKNMWYIWPGLSFFNYSALKDKDVNFGKWRRFGFLKVVGADTGSANWPVLYSKCNPENIRFASTSFWNIKKNSETDDFQIRELAQTELIQYFDNENWLHMIDGSEWQDSKGKTEMVYKLLDKILKKE